MTVSQVQKLAPALCADYGSVVVPWNGGVAPSSRTLNGALYVVACNSTANATTVPFRVDALAGRALTVLERADDRACEEGLLPGPVEPYAVHVYVAAPSEKSGCAVACTP